MSNQRKIRCLANKLNFFNLATKEKSNDCAHTIKEQIATENLIKESFEEFINTFTIDSE